MSEICKGCTGNQERSTNTRKLGEEGGRTHMCRAGGAAVDRRGSQAVAATGRPSDGGAAEVE